MNECPPRHRNLLAAVFTFVQALADVLDSGVQAFSEFTLGVVVCKIDDVTHC